VYKGYLKTYWIPMMDRQPYIYSLSNWISNKAIVFVKKWLLFPIAIAVAGDDPSFPGLTIKHYPFSIKRGWHINAYTINQYLDITVSNSKTGASKKLGIIGTPGELFEEIQNRFLNRSPAGKDDTFIFQEANDWVAYLFPLKEYMTQAGYEPFASTTPVAGDIMEKEMYRFWEEIKNSMISFS
jgi:hypothetical protein